MRCKHRIATAVITWMAIMGATLVLHGCSVKRVGVRDPAATGQTSGGAYDPQAERASPPAPAVASDPATGTPSPEPTLEVPESGSLGAPAVEVRDLEPAAGPPAAPTAPASPPAGASPAADAGSGYRVQVFAGTDEATAERVRADVAARLGETARVVYQAPYYKVRVGDCPTSEACSALQARLRDAGFATTWVVQASDTR